MPIGPANPEVAGSPGDPEPAVVPSWHHPGGVCGRFDVQQGRSPAATTQEGSVVGSMSSKAGDLIPIVLLKDATHGSYAIQEGGNANKFDEKASWLLDGYRLLNTLYILHTLLLLVLLHPGIPGVEFKLFMT
ncbi:hypothetical protein ACP4OV_014235 [Aristida adscensionis]